MTSPFSPVLVAQLKNGIQGGTLQLATGRQIYPKFFCCISGTTVGVAKDPVAVLIVDPTEQLVLYPLTADYSHSWSPSSTLVSWDIDWGDGNISSGAWPGTGTESHPSGGYAMPGTYVVTLTVTDMLGATAEDEVEVTIRPPTFAGYAGCGTSGVWYTQTGEVWEERAGVVLHDVPVYDLKVSPYSVVAVSEVYPETNGVLVFAAAGTEGLFYSDDGAMSWTALELPFKDLDVRAVLPSVVSNNEVYALAQADNIVYLLKTTDLGESWQVLPIGYSIQPSTIEDDSTCGEPGGFPHVPSFTYFGTHYGDFAGSLKSRGAGTWSAVEDPVEGAQSCLTTPVALPGLGVYYVSETWLADPGMWVTVLKYWGAGSAHVCELPPEVHDPVTDGFYGWRVFRVSGGVVVAGSVSWVQDSEYHSKSGLFRWQGTNYIGYIPFCPDDETGYYVYCSFGGRILAGPYEGYVTGGPGVTYFWQYAYGEGWSVSTVLDDAPDPDPSPLDYRKEFGLIGVYDDTLYVTGGDGFLCEKPASGPWRKVRFRAQYIYSYGSGLVATGYLTDTDYIQYITKPAGGDWSLPKVVAPTPVPYSTRILQMLTPELGYDQCRVWRTTYLPAISLPDSHTSQLLAQSADGQYIYAVALSEGQGLVVRVDYNLGELVVLTTLTDVYGNAMGVVTSPYNPGELWAYGPSGLYRSDDYGETMTALTPSVSPAFSNPLLVIPDKLFGKTRVYYSGGGSDTHVIETSNNGLSWAQLASIGSFLAESGDTSIFGTLHVVGGEAGVIYASNKAGAWTPMGGLPGTARVSSLQLILDYLGAAE